MSTGYTSLTTYQASVMSLKFEELEERGTSDDFEKKLMLLTDVCIDGIADSTELYTFTIRMFASLQSLNLIGVPPSTIRDLSIFRAQLKVLEVSNTGIFNISDLLVTNDEIQVLQSLPHLINESGNGSSSNFNNDTSEEELIAMNNDIKNEMLKKGDEFILSRGWRAMRTLRLTNCGINIMDESFLMLPSLELLDLSHNELIDVVNLQRCYGLSSLNLSYNQISSLLDFGFTLGCIRELNLSHNKIQSLEGLDRLLALEKLDLRHNDIAIIEEVDYLVALPRFSSLHLKGCAISNSTNYRISILSRFVQDPSLLHTSSRATDSNITRGNEYLNEIAQAVPILDGCRATVRESKELKSMIFIPVEGQPQSRFSRSSSCLPRSPHRNRSNSGNSGKNSFEVSNYQIEQLKELAGVGCDLKLNAKNNSKLHEKDFAVYLNPDLSSGDNQMNGNDNNDRKNKISSMNEDRINFSGTMTTTTTTTTTIDTTLSSSSSSSSSSPSDGTTLALVSDTGFLSPAQSKSQYTSIATDSQTRITPQTTDTNGNYSGSQQMASGQSERSVTFSFVNRTPEVMPRPVARKALIYATAQHMQQATSTPSPRDVKNLLQQLEIETRHKKPTLSSKVSDIGPSTDDFGFEDSDGSLSFNNESNDQWADNHVDDEDNQKKDLVGCDLDNIIDPVHDSTLSTPSLVAGKGGLPAIEAAVERFSTEEYSSIVTSFDGTIASQSRGTFASTFDTSSHANFNDDRMSNIRTWSNDTRNLLESLGVPETPFTSDSHAYSTKKKTEHPIVGPRKAFSVCEDPKSAGPAIPAPETSPLAASLAIVGGGPNEIDMEAERARSSLRLSSSRERECIERDSFTDAITTATTTGTTASLSLPPSNITSSFDRNSYQGNFTPTSVDRPSIDRHSLDNRSFHSDGDGFGGGEDGTLDNSMSTFPSPTTTPQSAKNSPKPNISRSRGAVSRENLNTRMSDDLSEGGNSVSDDASWRSSFAATSTTGRNSLSRPAIGSPSNPNPTIRESQSLIDNEADISVNTISSEDATLQYNPLEQHQRVTTKMSASSIGSNEDSNFSRTSESQSLAPGESERNSLKWTSYRSIDIDSKAKDEEKKAAHLSMFNSSGSSNINNKDKNSTSDTTNTVNKHQNDILPEDQQVYLGRRDKESHLVGSRFEEYLREQVFLGKNLASLSRHSSSLSASALSYNGQHAARERDRIGKPYLVDERGVQLGSASSRWVTSGVGNRDSLGIVRMTSHSMFSSSVPNETVMNVFKICTLVKTTAVTPSSQKNLRQSLGDDEREMVDFSVGDSNDEEETLIYVLTDVHLYVMRTELWSRGSVYPANMLVFSQAPVPIVLNKHPLEALNRLTLFFGMQRLILDFIESTIQMYSNDDGGSSDYVGNNIGDVTVKDITSDGSGRLGADADYFMRLDPSNRGNSNGINDGTRLTSLVDRMISSHSNCSNIQERSYIVLGREKVECHRFVVAVMKAANLRKTRASPPLKSTFVSNKDSELLDALPALFPNYMTETTSRADGGPRNIAVIANPDLYQMCYRCYRKKPGFLESRTVIVSGRYVLLCNEALFNHKVHLKLVDSTRDKDIHKIIAEESPLRVTLVLNPRGGSSFAQFTRRKWRLEAPSNSACVRMLDHFRALAPHAMEIDG